MKRITISILTILSLLLVPGCGESADEIIPGNISNVTAQSAEGAILLKWDNPKDENFLYVQIEYEYDYKGVKMKGIKQISHYASEFLLDNLYAKYGDVKFKLWSVSSTGTSGTNIETISSQALPVTMVKVEHIATDKIILTPADLSTSGSADEGSLADLLGDDPAGFFHTPWRTPTVFPHWIQFDLSKAVEGVKLVQYNRDRVNNNPDAVDILGSNDGETWVTMGSIPSGTIPSGISARYASPVFSVEGQTFTKIRYQALAGYEGNTFYAISRIEFYEVWYEIIDPELD
ncbi:MAG: DUF4959 domain-containing protein [Proteiniphilum sp.]